MNPVLKGQIIQAIRDPRNKAVESDFIGNSALHFTRDTMLMNKNSEQIMRLDEIGDYNRVRYLLKIGGRAVFDITREPGCRHKIGIEDEWDIVMELRRAVDYHRDQNGNQNDKTPLTPKERSIIDFLQQKQR